MPKGRTTRRIAKPPRPAGVGPLTPGAVPDIDLRRLTAPTVWRDFVLVLIVLLASGATAFIWLSGPPTLLAGLMPTGIVWLVSLVGILGRLQARYGVRQLRAIVQRNEVMAARLEPDITEERSGLRMRHIPAWAVGILGLAASAILWQADFIERTLGGTATVIVGGTFSIMLALSVAANAVNRAKARRLAKDFRAALGSERLALDTLGSIDAMVSACLPTGERTRFNDRFVKFVGLPAAQLQGRGWLEAVHPEDREAALEIAARPVSSNRAREHDLCIRGKGGGYVWLHETLVPRFDDRGRFIEFICTAVDITSRVENEAVLHKQISDLKADVEHAQAEATESKTELNDLRAEATKAKASRTRLEASLEESRAEVKSLQAVADRADAKVAETKAESAKLVKEAQADARTRVRQAEEAADLRVSRIEASAEERVAKAEQAADELVAKASEDAAAQVARTEQLAAERIAKAKADAEELAARAKQAAEERSVKLDESLRAARQEQQQAVAESRKLQKAFEKLQEELAEFKLQSADLREQVARQIREAREAKEQAAEAVKGESAHRARSDRLTQRCEQLEAQLADRDAQIGERDAKLAERAEALKGASDTRAKSDRLAQRCKQLESQLAERDAQLAERTKALKGASDLGARTDRLMQRCEALEAELAQRDARIAEQDEALAATRASAKKATAESAKEIERRLHEVSAKALAGQLRRHLDGTQRMMQELMATSLEGPVRDAADNTAATLRAMSQLVDHAISGTTPPIEVAEPAAPAAAASFDLRRTARGLQDLLAPDAEARGVTLDIEAASGFRPVHGDEIGLRTALLSLTTAALGLVEKGKLIVRLTEDVSTGAHTTIRCQMSHDGPRLTAGDVETALALRDEDGSMPDPAKQPVAYGAARAWRTIRALEGQHGFQLPDGGGFTIWLTFTLDRPAAKAWQNPTAPPPAPAAAEPAPAADAEPADEVVAEEEHPAPRKTHRRGAAHPRAVEPPEPSAIRTLPRMPQEFLTCNLGEVAELGAGGMRIFCAKPPKGPDVTVSFEKNILAKELQAEISWSKKVGRNKHDVGLKFVGLTPDEQKQILRIAMQHRRIVTMLEDAANG